MTTAETVPQEAVREEERQVKSEKEERVNVRVRVFGKWCKGCGLCIAFCPRHVFEADAEQRPVVAHPERCVACQWCVIHCPDFAIVVDEIEAGAKGAAK